MIDNFEYLYSVVANFCAHRNSGVPLFRCLPLHIFLETNTSANLPQVASSGFGSANAGFGGAKTGEFLIYWFGFWQ